MSESAFLGSRHSFMHQSAFLRDLASLGKDVLDCTVVHATRSGRGQLPAQPIKRHFLLALGAVTLRTVDTRFHISPGS